MKTITLKNGNEIKLNQAFNMDCLDFMEELPDNIIDLTVTSPPYDNLRTYNGSLEWNETIWKSIIKELYRLTSPGGVIVWNVADATVNGSETGTSFKQALYAIECGFNLHDTMMYAKNNYIPLTHNRYEQQFEYMFIWSKGKPKTFNPIYEYTKTAGIERSRKKSNKEEGSAVRSRNEKTETKARKIKPNIWFYNVSNSDVDHPAVFPKSMVIDHIGTWTEKGDIIFDPFMGGFTTAIAASDESRNWIGTEKDVDYFKSGYHRYEQETKQLLMDF